LDYLRRRLAVNDLFLGPYPAMIAALQSKRTVGELQRAGNGLISATCRWTADRSRNGLTVTTDFIDSLEEAGKQSKG
jgi:hypothetical protein